MALPLVSHCGVLQQKQQFCHANSGSKRKEQFSHRNGRSVTETEGAVTETGLSVTETLVGTKTKVPKCEMKTVVLFLNCSSTVEIAKLRNWLDLGRQDMQRAEVGIHNPKFGVLEICIPNSDFQGCHHRKFEFRNQLLECSKCKFRILDSGRPRQKLGISKFRIWSRFLACDLIVQFVCWMNFQNLAEAPMWGRLRSEFRILNFYCWSARNLNSEF